VTFDAVLELETIGMGVRLAAQEPPMNAVAERFVRIIYSECTDRILIASERRPEAVLDPLRITVTMGAVIMAPDWTCSSYDETKRDPLPASAEKPRSGIRFQPFELATQWITTVRGSSQRHSLPG
jgi:hypothetical protein